MSSMDTKYCHSCNAGIWLVGRIEFYQYPHGDVRVDSWEDLGLSNMACPGTETLILVESLLTTKQMPFKQAHFLL